MQAYRALGTRSCAPIYNALNPSTHHPAPPDPRFAGELGFLGNRLPDREGRVEEFFLPAAEAWPEGRFLLGGSGWGDKRLPGNVRYLGHVYTRDHNAFNDTPRAVLNVSRASMAACGFSPATRLFEAAAGGVPIISDDWEGLGTFFSPGEEILVAQSPEDTLRYLGLPDDERRAVGERARASWRSTRRRTGRPSSRATRLKC